MGIAITRKCNISCRHCISECQPNSTEKLSLQVIEKLIEQTAGLGTVKSIVFTGGETFLEYEKLIYAVSLCEKLGLEASVITNGFWASTVETAKQKLSRLKGLKILNVSVDSFHQEFIPINQIHNTIKACKELGIKCIVNISYLNDPVQEISKIKQQLAGLDDLYEPITQPIAPFGRVLEQIDINSIYSYDPTGIPCVGADGPIIEANGKIMFCCGGLALHPDGSLFQMGNADEVSLEKVKQSAEKNPIVQTLRLRGPSGLMSLVKTQAEADGVEFVAPQEGEAMDLCSLCKYVVSNPEYVRLLKKITQNPKVKHDIALLRLIELGEISLSLQKNEINSVNST